MFNQKILQYLCRKCGTVLKELDAPINNISTNREECPICKSLISSTLIERNYDERTQLSSQLSRRQEALLEFRTAYELNYKNNTLDFGIEQLDYLINFSNSDRGCVVGNKKYTDMIVTRLCIRALMPKSVGGFDSPNVIIIDGGNSLDFYLFVNFARQYGLNTKSILQQIIVSRAFTVYQLTDLIITEIPRIIQHYNSKVVIISNFLEMFLCEPSLDINEAEYLIREVKHSLTETKILQNVLVIMSWNYSIQRFCRYNNILSTIFEKRVEIIEKNKNKIGFAELLLATYNNCTNKSIKRSQILLEEQDLKTVSTINRILKTNYRL